MGSTLDITTETRTLENLEQAAETLKNADSDMIREWLLSLVPGLLGFALQVVLAIVVYVAGEVGSGYRRKAVFGCAVKMRALLYFNRYDPDTVWRYDGFCRGGCRFCGPCAWPCPAGKPFQFCRRGFDSDVKAV